MSSFIPFFKVYSFTRFSRSLMGSCAWTSVERKNTARNAQHFLMEQLYNFDMRHSIARGLLPLGAGIFAVSLALMLKRVEPFYTFFYLISWWSYILALDSWLFLKGGESMFLEKPVEFISFWAPFSAFVWFVFEAFNLRLANWHYLGVPREIWLRWPGNFLAFGSVIPGIYLTAGLLERLRLFQKNDFSFFLAGAGLKPAATYAITMAGFLMLILPLIWPRLFFPL